MAVKVGEGKWGPGGSADVTPDFADTGYRWANFGGGSQAVVGDALRLTWDVDPVGSGYYGPTLGFYVDDAGIFSNDFYVEFDAKFPGNVNGCKFVKFFGRRSVEQGYSNATFNLLWGTGEFANIIFTDGTDLEGDAGRAIFFSGGNNALNIGRAWGTAVVSTPQNRSFTDTDFGNTWHHFRFRYKQNTGTTSGNEVADGVFYVEIDGQVYLSVTNIFNRNPSNIPGIDNIQFGGWSQDGGGAFDLDIRNVVISTGGFMDALPDTTPDAFTIPAVTNAVLNTPITSAPVTPTGYDTAAPLTVTSGTASIAGGAYSASPGNISPGQSFTARVQSSATPATATSATVTIGGVSANFTATTIAADTTPDSFSFSPITDSALSTQQTSNTITISGLNTSATVSITGGAYSKNGSAYTTSPGNAVNSDTLSVRHNSSALNSTQITTTLTVGTFSTNFISITIPEETTMPESRVRDWTNTTNNLLDTGVNFFAFDDGLDNIKPGVKVPPKAFLKSILPANATSPSYLLNDGVCSIGTHVDAAVISAPGLSGLPNHIGKSNFIPLGADSIHSWAFDSGYVPATAAADIAAIYAGYDNVNNQLAGVLGGFHCYLQYNLDGHSSILSGSYQWNAGGRSVIIQGTQNKITSSVVFGFLGNGRYNTLSSNWATLVNGTDVNITGIGGFGGFLRDGLLSAEGSAVLSGKVISNAATYATAQGKNITVSSAASYAIAMGLDTAARGVHSFSKGSKSHAVADYSAVSGEECVASASYSITHARHAHNNQRGALMLSGGKTTLQSDSGTYIGNSSLRTTNATIGNMLASVSGGVFFCIPDNAHWTCRILLTATNEADGSSNSWEIIGDVKRFNGTTSISGTTTVTPRAAEMTISTPPSLTVSAAEGLVRVSVTGIAATNIIWNASWQISQTIIPWSDTFTAATTDVLTLATAAKRLQNGEKVRVSTDGTLPGGLLAATDYWVIEGTNYYGNVSFKLATTPTGFKTVVTTSTINGQSVNSTSQQTSVVDITDIGTGNHTILRV